MKRFTKKLLVYITLLIIILIAGILFIGWHSNEKVLKEKWTPWDYDLNGDGTISINEMIRAKNQYVLGEISREQVVEVIKIYFETAPVVGKV